jgi:hypothetical protein
VGRFPGESEQTLRAEVSVMANTRGEHKPWSRPPIAMQFSVRVRLLLEWLQPRALLERVDLALIVEV